jgi:hypothetical protein
MRSCSEKEKQLKEVKFSMAKGDLKKEFGWSNMLIEKYRENKN